MKNFIQVFVAVSSILCGVIVLTRTTTLSPVDSMIVVSMFALITVVMIAFMTFDRLTDED